MANDTFRLERSTTIVAPPETVFSFIDDFHQWALWSPWDKMDADLAKTYSGPDQGKGAVYEWVGKKTGQGRMEILTSTPTSLIEIDLRFLKPFKAQNLAIFTLVPEAGGVRVTWAMTGTQNLMMKAMGLFFSMDKTVGKDFESGLASLKAISEAKMAAAA